jgi:hypothetical protein
MATRIKRKLDDQHISALLDFSQFGIYWDTDVRGLRLRVGPRKATWQFFAEHSVHGRRSTTHRTLGFYPVMGTIVARKAALVEAGRVAAKHLTPGKRTAVRLGAALDDYLKFLKAKAGRRGKPPRHAVNVANLRSLPFAAFINASTSRSSRCSRLRYALLGFRVGMALRVMICASSRN